MTRWWSLARGEWVLLAFLAGGGVGVVVATTLGIGQVGAWFVCLGVAVIFAVVAHVITRGRGDTDLPKVSLSAMLLVSIPLLTAWWIVAALAGMPTSGFSPTYLVWFVGGLVVARVLARVLSSYGARNRNAEERTVRNSRTPS